MNAGVEFLYLRTEKKRDWMIDLNTRYQKVMNDLLKIAIATFGLPIVFHKQIFKMEKNTSIYKSLIAKPDLLFSLLLLTFSIGIIFLYNYGTMYQFKAKMTGSVKVVV